MLRLVSYLANVTQKTTWNVIQVKLFNKHTATDIFWQQCAAYRLEAEEWGWWPDLSGWLCQLDYS